jgi:LytS/YehU family sensor histidine kinase
MNSLQAQMNPHFLFNSLNSVKSLIDRDKSEEAITYLTKFSQLIRNVLNSSRERLIRLEDDLKSLKLYIELEKLRFSNFNYTISVADNVAADFIEVPSLLLQPFVENALWHGLQHKTEGVKELKISIYKKAGNIYLEVEDNGVGRANSQRFNEPKMGDKESLGMRIAQDRIALLNKMNEYEASLIVEDVDESNIEFPGTKVTIKIPAD